MSYAAAVAFWISLGFVVYVYLGYPVLLFVWRALAEKPVHKVSGTPPVTIILAAHNEQETIAQKLRNCLEQDYPPDRLEIMVSLDGPTDGTEQVARQFENNRVHVLHCADHRGKTAALNAAAAAAQGEILVFVDARQRLDQQAIRELVADFADPSVGAVSGELMISDSAMTADDRQAGSAVGLYWRYEKYIRQLESGVHSVVGATGALYALRRELFRALSDDLILDDVAIPMQAVLHGKRIVFEPAARVYDRSSCCPRGEFGRKVRTLAGNYQLIGRMPELMAPWRNRIWLQFVSHKVGRLLVPYFLAVLFLSNALLWRGWYPLIFLLQLAWYSLAALGALGAEVPRGPQQPAVILVQRDYEEGS